MDNKIEIFKLTIAAGQEKFSEEQTNFLVECFVKTEQLTTVTHKKPFSGVNHQKGPKQTHQKQTHQTQKQSGPKTQTGHSLFMRDMMAQLKTNGQSYQENKKSALEAWKLFLPEDKKVWDDKALVEELEL
jgi:hypothetical protein